MSWVGMGGRAGNGDIVVVVVDEAGMKKAEGVRS